MAYTDAWDVTQPPDTQQANLLAQDSRTLKLDVMERMRTISGTFANRPTPDSGANADFTGVLYFATDTAQIFQWNGASWTEITRSFATPVLYRMQTPFGHTGTTSLDTLFTIAIPANTLTHPSMLRIEVFFEVTTLGGGNLTFELYLDTSAVVLQTTQQGASMFDIRLVTQAANNSQRAYVDFIAPRLTTGASAGFITTEVLDLTLSHNIIIKTQATSVTANIRIDAIKVSIV